MKPVTDFPAPSIWMAHRISYAETDAMGLVYYAEYLQIFERARDTYIRSSGMSYREVEERGIYLPVREVRCRYRSPARFDDIVYCHVGVSDWGRASLTFVYELMKEDKKTLLATGMTQHAAVGKAGKPVALPVWMRDLERGVPDGETFLI